MGVPGVDRGDTYLGRDGRVDEGAGLENQWAPWGLVGSNPTLSAESVRFEPRLVKAPGFFVCSGNFDKLTKSLGTSM